MERILTKLEKEELLHIAEHQPVFAGNLLAKESAHELFRYGLVYHLDADEKLRIPNGYCLTRRGEYCLESLAHRIEPNLITFEEFLNFTLERNKLDFSFAEQQILGNEPFFRQCWRDDLSPYKALVFFEPNTIQ